MCTFLNIKQKQKCGDSANIWTHRVFRKIDAVCLKWGKTGVLLEHVLLQNISIDFHCNETKAKDKKNSC